MPLIGGRGSQAGQRPGRRAGGRGRGGGERGCSGHLASGSYERRYSTRIDLRLALPTIPVVRRHGILLAILATGVAIRLAVVIAYPTSLYYFDDSGAYITL